MLKIYNTDIETNKMEEIKEFKKGSWINLVNPSEMEIKKVSLHMSLKKMEKISILRLMAIFKVLFMNNLKKTEDVL